MTELDGTAVMNVAMLAEKATVAEDKIIHVKVAGEELPFTQYNFTELKPAKQPTPDVLCVSTLDSLIGYLRENRDGLPLDKLTAHVVGPALVEVVGPLAGYHRQREVYVSAEIQPPASSFRFGQYHAVEDMLVSVLSLFGTENDHAEVVDLLGNVTGEEAVQNTDDGISQTVGVRKGVKRKAEEAVKNPVYLRPYRTFPDVEKPYSPFILRLRRDDHTGQVSAALFEADGGKWRLTAVASIAAYLRESGLEELGVSVIA